MRSYLVEYGIYVVGSQIGLREQSHLGPYCLQYVTSHEILGPNEVPGRN